MKKKKKLNVTGMRFHEKKEEKEYEQKKWRNW